MQGRFSGRLALKEDEKRLVEECRLLAPLLGGVGKRSDKSRLTLARIVRGIACGAVRRYCQAREEMLTVSATEFWMCTAISSRYITGTQLAGHVRAVQSHSSNQ
jgi:hypothetical protein